MQDYYEWLTNIKSLKFDSKSVLIIGGGNMAVHYASALSQMNIKDVTIITKNQEDVFEISKKFKIRSLVGGYEKNLPLVGRVDLVILATPIPMLISAAELALECGQDNILIEKPGSIYSQDLLSFEKKIKSQKVKVAYNRLSYPSLHKLKILAANEGGISSCRFTFTEMINRIKFNMDYKDVYSRWGVSNSLHVISMAIELMGMPREISSYQFGKLDWHPSGSIFVGSGVTENDVPFSYHADWGSGGRWGIEVITKENAYSLIPLEELHVSPKGSFTSKSIPLKIAFPNVKAGIAEEIALMLDYHHEFDIGPISLRKAAELVRAAEKIFGYNSK